VKKTIQPNDTTPKLLAKSLIAVCMGNCLSIRKIAVKPRSNVSVKIIRPFADNGEKRLSPHQLPVAKKADKYATESTNTNGCADGDSILSGVYRAPLVKTPLLHPLVDV